MIGSGELRCFVTAIIAAANIFGRGGLRESVITGVLWTVRNPNQVGRFSGGWEWWKVGLTGASSIASSDFTFSVVLRVETWKGWGRWFDRLSGWRRACEIREPRASDHDARSAQDSTGLKPAAARYSRSRSNYAIGEAQMHDMDRAAAVSA